MVLEGLATRTADNIVYNQLGSITDIFTGSNFTAFYGFLLPWIFTFAIVYGVLAKIGTFTNDRVNVALAFVIAFFVTGIGGPQLAAFFTSLFGGMSVFLAGILVVLIFAGLVGGENKIKNSTIAVIVVIIIGIFLFLGSTGSVIGSVFISAQLASGVFWLIIIIIAAYLIVRGGGGSSGGTPTPSELKKK